MLWGVHRGHAVREAVEQAIAAPHPFRPVREEQSVVQILPQNVRL